MSNPHTAVIVFSNAVRAAVRLAADPKQPAKVRKQAEFAAYANARACARAALRAS